MPTGTGAETLNFLPEVPFAINPSAFFDGTEKQWAPVVTGLAAPGPGNRANFNIPRAGVVSKLLIQFDGSLTVTAGGTLPTPGFLWPYGLINNWQLSANGMSTDLHTLMGVDLMALRFARFPAYVEHVDVFPGAVGGGGSAISAGVYPLHLTWEIPISIDDTTLIGALYAQSSSLTLRCQITQETMANLVAPGGTVADWAITGNFTVQELLWKIPIVNNTMQLPDITRLHQMISFDQPFTNTGEVTTPIIRTSGQLIRLFFRAMSAFNVPLLALPGAPAANTLDAIRVQYGGGTEKPWVFNPAFTLSAVNGQHYGAPLPYDTLAFDQVRENPIRDALFMQGVTELAVTATVDPAVVPAAGALTHVMQEMLL